MSQSGVYETNVSPGDQPVLFVAGNDAVDVPPNPATGVINIIGASGISTSGTPGSYTLTITGSSTGSTTNGDIGSIAGPDVTIYCDQAALGAGSSVYFGNSGTVSTLHVTDSNDNTILGAAAGNLSISGIYNCGYGFETLVSLTSGSSNCAVGSLALNGITSGSYNVGIGAGAGTSYNGTQSSNILLNSGGISSDNNILRIGAGTGSGNQQLSSAYISGIDGTNLNTANVVVEVSDQLGTAVLTAGTNITITPGTNTITIDASGALTSVTLDGDSGSATGATLTVYADQAALNSGSTVAFVNSGSTSTLNVSDSNDNTIIGAYSGILGASASVNTGLGTYVLSSMTTGSDNVAIGYGSLYYLTSGEENTAVGSEALEDLTTGSYNTGIGIGALEDLTQGSYNCALGYYAGYEYEGSEASNVVINHYGVGGENNTLHIGAGTGTGDMQLQAAYISGIDQVNLNTANVVVEVSDQLGTAVLTAGPGISITPGTNTITIASTEYSAYWNFISASQTMLTNNGYMCVGGATLSLSLPTTSSPGDEIEVILSGSTSFTITQSVGQQIRYGDVLTTSGAGGSLASTMQGDSIRLVCQTANAFWIAASVIGNLTIV